MYLNGKDVALYPRSLVHHVLDGNTDLTQGPGQLGDAARTIADGDRELDQPAVGGQPAFQTTTQDGGVDVAAAQKNDNAKINS